MMATTTCKLHIFTVDTGSTLIFRSILEQARAGSRNVGLATALTGWQNLHFGSSDAKVRISNGRKARHAITNLELMCEREERYSVKTKTPALSVNPPGLS
jgi:hypothetical protein